MNFISALQGGAKAHDMFWLVKAIKKKRPNLNDSTLDSYASYVRTIYRLIEGDKKAIPSDAVFLKHVDKVKTVIEDKSDNTKKNIYNAIVVALDAVGAPKKVVDTYSKLRDDRHKIYEDRVNNSEKSETQKDNWVSLKDIDDILEKYKMKFENLKTRDNLSNKNINTIQDYVLLSIYRNMPLRNDIANMFVLTKSEYDDIDDKEKEKHNYYVADEGKFYINEFKTKKTRGKNVISIPDKVNDIIKEWLKINKTKFLINKKNQRDPINANGITKQLNALFEKETGKKVSTSMLRHIYLSEKYGDIMEEMENDSEVMMHSLATQKQYVLNK